MKIAVTGAEGFLGRHVAALLRFHAGDQLLPITRRTPPQERIESLRAADAVIHLAGVNRPKDEREYFEGNVKATRQIVEWLRQAGGKATLVFSSSIRADEDSPYGRSKAAAEAEVRGYAEQTGAAVAIFRLPNVFGKWSKPFYNSAIATFCYSLSRGLPIDVHDPERTLTLAYAEDVAFALLDAARNAAVSQEKRQVWEVAPTYTRSLDEIVRLLGVFHQIRTDLLLPDFSDEFAKKLHTTYVSFIPSDELAYALKQYVDERGALAELLKSPFSGQVFVSRTKPGVTRGNHFHHTKTEKFVVVEGDALIRLREVGGTDIIEFPVKGAEFRVVDIPPGFTHSISNNGNSELVTLFWSSEIFDRAKPDTYQESVVRDAK